MQAQLENPAEEVARLQRCLNDLVSLLALPALWSGSEPSQIARWLLDVLPGMLRLDLLYIRLKDVVGETSVEMARVSQSRKLKASPHDIGEALNHCLGDDPHKWPPLVRTSIGNGDLSIVPLRLGVDAQMGVIVAGSQRANFPDQTEGLLLSVAANQAAIGLQEARLLSEQKRGANELEQRVAQRTRELAAANEGLRKEVAVRKRVEDALRQSEARLADGERDLQLTIDTIPVFVAIYRPDGTRSFVNRTWQEYMGLTLEEATGAGAKTFPHFHPDDAERNDKAWRDALRKGEPLSIEVRVCRADGQYRWHTSRRVPLRDEKGDIIKWYSVGIDIEDQKVAEDALRRSEEALRREVMERTRAEQLARMDETRFRRFFDLPLIGMGVTSPERRFLEVNEKLCQILGYPREELIGRDWASITHPDDLPDNLGLMDQAMAGMTEIYSMDKRYMHRDGQIVYASISVCCVRRTDGTADHFVLTVQDVTARRRAEEALRQSEQRFRDYAEAASDWLWETGPDHRFTWFSLGSTRVHQPDNRIGRTRWEIAAEVHEEPGKWAMHIATLDAHEPFRGFTYRTIQADGSFAYLAVSGRPVFDAQGSFQGYRGVASDVTAAVRADQAEKALRQTQAELAHVTRVTSLGALTASIAHEVNQPLSGIITNAGTCLRMLANDPPNIDGARETARRTLRDGNRASEVITRLRTLFSKKDSVLDAVDLNEATREVIAMSSSELQRDRLVTRLELADDLPAVVGDRVQLQQVILNLLLNAADAMSDVEDRPRQLLIRTERDDSDRALLSVQDTGVGLDPQSMDKLFQAFYTTKSNGMGIGLSVSRSIIERHRGRLWAERNDGPGATFSFSIPCGRPL